MLFLPGLAWANCGSCGEKKACGESPCAKRTACAEAAPCAPVACAPCQTKCETKCPPAVKADIERLRAINPKCSTQLCVAYQVDLENACADDYDLLVQVKCKKNGSIMFERVVALDNPYNTHGHHRRYRASFQDDLAQTLGDRDDFYIEGNVIPRGSAENGALTARSIDREREPIHKSAGDHGYATALYTTAGYMYTPVRWITTGSMGM